MTARHDHNAEAERHAAAAGFHVNDTVSVLGAPGEWYVTGWSAWLLPAGRREPAAHLEAATDRGRTFTALLSKLRHSRCTGASGCPVHPERHGPHSDGLLFPGDAMYVPQYQPADRVRVKSADELGTVIKAVSAHGQTTGYWITLDDGRVVTAEPGDVESVTDPVMVADPLDLLALVDVVAELTAAAEIAEAGEAHHSATALAALNRAEIASRLGLRVIAGRYSDLTERRAAAAVNRLAALLAEDSTFVPVLFAVVIDSGANRQADLQALARRLLEAAYPTAEHLAADLT